MRRLRAHGAHPPPRQDGTDIPIFHPPHPLPPGRLAAPDMRLPQPMEWRIRDQGPAPTCIAFAITDALEWLAWKATGTLQRLSPAYLHWTIKHEVQRPPTLRTWVRDGMHAASRHGVCRADLMPYRFDPLTLDVPGPPDHAARADAEQRRHAFRPGSYSNLEPGRSEVLVACLRAGRPAVISLPAFVPVGARRDPPDNWNTALATRHGIVTQPMRVADPAELGTLDAQDRAKAWTATGDGHAVCIIGFVADPAERRGGWFLFRNSWGVDWTTDNPSAQLLHGLGPHWPAGHGVLSASMIDLWCWEVLTF